MDIKKIYDDAFLRFGSSRILFRGFLLEMTNGGVISLKDIRNPYYREVSQMDLSTILDLGFEYGTTYLLMKSDSRKVARYNRLIANKKKLLEVTNNPRKKMEHMNAIARYTTEINYYESQVRRWQQFTKTI